MQRQELLNQIVQELEHFKYSRPLRVGINGIGCAGKTTLTNELTTLLRLRGQHVITASIDSFHHPREYRYRQGQYSSKGYYEDAFNLELVTELLLEPVSTPPFPKKCIRSIHDVCSDIPIIDQDTVDINSMLLFEGVFIFRPELNDYWDYRIFIEISYETYLSRAFQRDLKLLGSREMVVEKLNKRYIPAQEMYLTTINPKKISDLIVLNDNPREPEIYYPTKVKSTSKRAHGLKV